MEILHNNIPYMKMPVLIFIEIIECNEMCSKYLKTFYVLCLFIVPPILVSLWLCFKFTFMEINVIYTVYFIL